MRKILDTTVARRNNMKAIRSQSKLENEVSKKLWHAGIRFRKNDKTLFGKPDISIKKYKIVIFIDSCFWHVCEIHGNFPKNNSEFWKEKLLKNVERDKKVTSYYINKKWKIKRIWEHELKDNNEKVIKELIKFIQDQKK